VQTKLIPRIPLGFHAEADNLGQLERICRVIDLKNGAGVDAVNCTSFAA
jgi:hypothetical protein